MTVRVHFGESSHDKGSVDLLRKYVDKRLVITSSSGTPDAADYEILVTGFPTEMQMTASPNLRAVVVPFAGVPAPTCKLVARFPQVSLHNLHYNVVPTAEMALTLLLAAAKFVVPIDRELREGDWRSRYTETPVAVLHGKTALIIGYGQIGQHLAPILQAMGMNVIGVRRDPPAPGDGDDVEVYPPGALHQLLPRTNALVNILPLTPETKGMIGADEFALMPNDAIVVNIGRGPTIDEKALFDALTNGCLLAAGLDVWYNYPAEEADRADTPPSQYPFHELDNVVMSPHRAGYLSAAEEGRMINLANLLNAAAADDPLPSEVNKDLGY
jgi:phosphoglycerate dehydrogenase-like enzyme